jgi:hypothetical protein
MALAIGLSFIGVWVIGFPAFIFRKLYIYRYRLGEKDFILEYGLFYVGLTEQAFFWEVVISNIRKVVFVSCSTLLSGQTPLIKAIVAVLALFI